MVKFVMVREIVQIGQSILTKKAKTVKKPQEPEIKALVKDLLDTCQVNEDGTAGLSAPQIGVSKRVCVCRRTDLEDNGEVLRSQLWEVMINPEIIHTSGKKSYYWEGCLSVGTGNNALFGPVARSDQVKISYFDLDGSKKKLNAKGYFAHIVQHEVDHLNGILFLSYIDNPKNIWKSSDLDRYIDKNGKYPPLYE